MEKLNRVLDAQKRYTFSDYFDLPFAVRDIVRGFGYQFATAAMAFKELDQPPDLTLLERTLKLNQRRSRLENEQARRSALVVPVLIEVCEFVNTELETEYAVAVSQHLSGVIDYQIESEFSLIVIEAKQSDLVRGFKQLAAELIAVAEWQALLREQESQVHGCVTDGERWQFGAVDQGSATLWQDLEIYSLDNLARLFAALVSAVRPVAANAEERV